MGLKVGSSALCIVVTNHSQSHLPNCAQYTIVQMLHSSMELSPSTQANSFSATQEIPRSLWKTTVHYSAHNSPLLALILRQHISLFASPSHNFKTYFPIVLSSTPKISKLSYIYINTKYQSKHNHLLYNCYLWTTCFDSLESSSGLTKNRSKVI